ncbi:hypothetical protein E4U61_002434 [Claviceps capensis]|nr:hypothetical protein E4U61_002434 [Claviceps capensis]
MTHEYLTKNSSRSSEHWLPNPMGKRMKNAERWRDECHSSGAYGTSRIVDLWNMSGGSTGQACSTSVRDYVNDKESVGPGALATCIQLDNAGMTDMSHHREPEETGRNPSRSSTNR